MPRTNDCFESPRHVDFWTVLAVLYFFCHKLSVAYFESKSMVDR